MQTKTYTQTATHARHIASKVAADLKRIQRIYQVNRPTDSEINDYQEEIALLLDADYLGSVTYGFKRNGPWVIALKYTVINRNLSGGDDPGGIRYEANISDANFGSFLSYSHLWNTLSQAEKSEFEHSLPIRRVGGNDPGAGMNWTGSRNYSSGELGVTRSMARRI